MPLRNLTAICAALIVSLACYQKALRNRHAATISESMRIIHDEYLEPVESQELFENAMRGMVGGLDRYSAFITEQEFSQFQESLDQKFGGIGIVVEVDPDSKRLTVMSPVVGTPAYRAGLRAGDTILEIDGHDTEGMTLQDSVTLMRGKPGTTVRVKVQHAGEQGSEDFEIQRAIIPIQSVLGDTRRNDGDWNFFLHDHPQIGYIRLTTFGEKTTDELRLALAQFDEHPVRGLILDVRNNAGGLLNTAVDTCDLFLDGGEIVSTRGRDGQQRDVYYAKSRVAVPLDLPMVVLTNGFSASASEIVAACLQDHRRAVVVGERTWGKGTVQNVISMEGGRSALKLTTASYWRPSGKNIHRREGDTEDAGWGVSPNGGLEVKLSDDQFKELVDDRRERDIVRVGPDGELLPPKEQPSGAGKDPQLQRAVEHLQRVVSETQAARA